MLLLTVTPPGLTVVTRFTLVVPNALSSKSTKLPWPYEVGNPVPILIQFVVPPISQTPTFTPLVCPFHRGRFTPVIFKSIELFPVLFTMLAATPTGREPITKLPLPLFVPYFTRGNCPSCG